MAGFTFSIAGGGDLQCVWIELEEGTDISIRLVIYKYILEVNS